VAKGFTQTNIRYLLANPCYIYRVDIIGAACCRDFCLLIRRFTFPGIGENVPSNCAEMSSAVKSPKGRERIVQPATFFPRYPLAKIS